LKKYQITFYFVEEGRGCGSEYIKKVCNVNCFDFFFFSVFLMDVMGGKITINLIEVHLGRIRRNTCTLGKI
jgi:hypothetical protein